MDERLKQRLVGAAVLVSFGVIFIPMVLNGSTAPEPVMEETNIPPKPKEGFSSRIVPLGDAPEPRAPQAPSPSPTETETAARTPDEDPSGGLAAESSPESSSGREGGQKVVGQEKDAGLASELSAWAVQLGSFAKTRNAITLRDRLRDKGYTAFVESAHSDEGQVTRVYVGPELQRADAEAALEKLEGEIDLKGIVVRYPGS